MLKITNKNEKNHCQLVGSNLLPLSLQANAPPKCATAASIYIDLSLRYHS